MKNKTTVKQSELVDEFTKQKQYVEKKASEAKRNLGLVFADAFLRGIRDLGYKSPGTAIDEMVDNSVQANASTVEVAFGFGDSRHRGSPNMIAIIDDGHGMIPDMIRFAVMWGGTHRENDRNGFGRYGYGLPSAAVSLAKRYTLYSKPADGEWHAVTIDLDELAAKAANGDEVEVPPYRRENPPTWLEEGTEELEPNQLKHGTVVVLENLDRLPGGWVQTATLQKKLLGHFGVVYRHLLPTPRIIVDKTEVQPVDPLFLMERGRFYDETSVMAEAIEVKPFEVETSDGRKGWLRVRASLLPAGFQSVDPKQPLDRADNNKRFPIMKEYNGLLICRARRQIDCIKPDWVTFINNDRNIKIELDFDPVLDEFFGITTSKQQITLTESMWSRLDAAGIRRLITDLRRKYKESLAEHDEAVAAATEAEDAPRPSEVAMEEAGQMIPTPLPPSPEKVIKAQQQLTAHAERTSQQTGKHIEQSLDDIKKQTEARPYKIEFKAMPEAPFYRPIRIGTQKRLMINTAHRFYTDVYNAPDVTPRTQWALEVLLFALGDGELDAQGAFEAFYVNARQDWSMRLTAGLSKLDTVDGATDRRSARMEELEVERVTKADAA